MDPKHKHYGERTERLLADFDRSRSRRNIADLAAQYALSRQYVAWLLKTKRPKRYARMTKGRGKRNDLHRADGPTGDAG